MRWKRRFWKRSEVLEQDFGAHGDVAELLGNRSLVLLGCGKMGGALLAGWLAAGIRGASLKVLEPAPSDALLERASDAGVAINPSSLPRGECVAVLAVKPQMMSDALPSVAPLAQASSLFVSIAAGITISRLAATLPGGRVIRTMPNTPAAIGLGVTALAAGPGVTARDRQVATALLSAVGSTVWLEQESSLDAVTAVSGSGPAYVFHLIECLAVAAEAEGLGPELALELARETVAGAGALAKKSSKHPAELRADVTSPAGTTAEALVELMNPQTGLGPLMERAVAAAARRSRELASV